MGLDMYLHRTTHKEVKEYTDYLNRRDECEKKLAELFTSKWKKILEDANFPKTKWGSYDYQNYTDEHKKIAKQYQDEVDAIEKEYGIKDVNCDEGSDTEEIGYWRKCWRLHNLINEKFNFGKEDNCVRIYLTKKNLKELIKELKKKPFEKEEYREWTDSDYEYTISIFKQAYDIIDCDEENVIYYYAWY